MYIGLIVSMMSRDCTIWVIAAWGLEVVLVEESADNRVVLALSFAGAARRYWLGVFPRVCAERRRRHARALQIPDLLLRRTALEAQRKWGNIEGAAAFAAFVPRRRRTAAMRAMTSFQSAYNYLDLLGEQPSADPMTNGARLHSALLVALDPDAPHRDYYEYQAQREDGGYLTEMIDACRAALAVLPSYTAVAPAARRAAERIVEFQSCHNGDRSEIGQQSDLEALERWARAITPADSELCWWETAAAGGSSLGVYALIALAARSDLDDGSPAASEAVGDAYFPWIGALHSLLDNLIDTAEDRATGQHNLLSCYASPQEAAARMGALAERSLRAARSLPDGRAHTLVLAAMASFYLSSPQARTSEALPVARAVLSVLNGPARLAMLVFRARRSVEREVDSRAIGSHETPHGERLPTRGESCT